jgi:hypothetical protein
MGEKDQDDKFGTYELLEIIEWSLPYEWRAKFDLDRYVPSHHDKARLIAEAEAIEKSETILVKPKSHETKEKKSSKSRKEKKNNPKNGKSSATEYFCTYQTHGTADCFTIKNTTSFANQNNCKLYKLSIVEHPLLSLLCHVSTTSVPCQCRVSAVSVQRQCNVTF